MLPAPEAALLTGGALIFQRTGLAFAGPVKGYRQAIFLSVKAVDEDLTRRATIFVSIGQIDKILLAEPACGFRGRGIGLRDKSMHVDVVAGEQIGAAEIAFVGNDVDLLKPSASLAFAAIFGNCPRSPTWFVTS